MENNFSNHLSRMAILSNALSEATTYKQILSVIDEHAMVADGLPVDIDLRKLYIEAKQECNQNPPHDLDSRRKKMQTKCVKRINEGIGRGRSYLDSLHKEDTNG